MRSLVAFAALILATTSAQAADVAITCTASSGFMVVPLTGIVNGAQEKSMNFSISSKGLKTSWGAPCNFMYGAVTKALVEVVCEGPSGAANTSIKRTIEINRTLGTYSYTYSIKSEDMANGTVGQEHGTCSKREGF
jgi:hypothetical protein